MQNKIEIYKDKNGNTQLEVNFDGDSVWLNQSQIVSIFGKDQSVISRHINNIFKDNEVDEKSNMQKMHIAFSDKPVNYYSLDIILAVGYRTNSKKAIEFRKWSSGVLKKYLLDGCTINEKKLSQTNDILNNLKQTINFLSTKSIGQEKEILNLLQTYTKTLTLLESYDKSSIDDINGVGSTYILKYTEVLNVICEIKTELIKKDEATHLFGSEKEKQLDSIVSNLYQTFSGMDLYPSIEDKASNLLYLIIKDHPFDDGNKRIASFVFIYFLDKCEYLYKKNGEKKINENALVH
jgi:prophage maintenance system killer protein